LTDFKYGLKLSSGGKSWQWSIGRACPRIFLEDLMKSILIFFSGLMIILSCAKKMPSEKDLFNQAQQYEVSQDYMKALDTYQFIMDNYKSSANRYKAVFMKGYIQMEYLKDNKKAVGAFDLLLSEYPESDLADDAKALREAAISGKDLMSIINEKDTIK
jgi:tetratricopeptide (TPR) repeat protein